MKILTLSVIVFCGCLNVVTFAQENTKQVLKRDFYVKTASSVKVEIDCPIGELRVRTKEQGPLAVLDLKNTLANFEYKVSYREAGGVGDLKVGGSGEASTSHEIESFSDFKKLLGLGNSIDNDNRWQVVLKETGDILYSLDLNMGLGDAEIELGAVKMNQLGFDCGLSDATLSINQPNPIQMDFMKVDNGMGSFEGKTLGNANFKVLKVSVGMGSATLDLRGDYTQDAHVKADVGMGSFKIVVPNNLDIAVTVNSSPFSSINLLGLVQESKTSYRSPNFGSGDYSLIFDINVGMGSVDLELVDPIK